ncbi:MAG: acylphosphatase [Actinomycetota bacterium]
MTMKRSHVYISGRVQGVFFRAWVAENARRLGLGGWVRNLFDGRVEAVFEGEPEKVDRMAALCHEGPEHARVDIVANDDSHAPEGLAGFEVRGTA